MNNLADSAIADSVLHSSIVRKKGIIMRQTYISRLSRLRSHGIRNFESAPLLLLPSPSRWNDECIPYEKLTTSILHRNIMWCMRWAVNIASPFLSPPWTMTIFSWGCCHQCVRLPKLPISDNWIISHHFWHYFGRATVPRKRPFCDPPGQSICSRPTLDFAWNRRGHIGLRGPTSPVEYTYRAIAKSMAQSRRFREFANLREPTRPADFISGSWNSYSSEA
jgi:hypothetical protein